MINENRMMLAAGVAVLALIAGCGNDSTSSNGSSPKETTETSSSATPEIKDPAVEAAALRTVDPCALLNETTLGDTGTLVPDSLSTLDWGECGVDVTDASGKTVEFVLRVGDQIILVDDPTEELEGLPLVVDDEDKESCWISVVTSYELSLAITFQVDYVGGDGCAAGKAALTKVVQAVHNNPPQYQQVPGSVLTVDPCTVADKEAIETALGQKSFMEVKNLHVCDFWSGDGTNYPLVSVSLLKGLPPDAEDGEPVDLGGGVTAIQAKEVDSSTVSCDVSWREIETPSEDEAPGWGELVSVEISGEPADLDAATACDKAVAVAKTVVPSLG
ncbi:DUF3558 family protein [Actinophytocola sp.]|uniref:DUF3558 family protein n=1 Tax=Actinophytocola sp. TaxID=1872138 RepID=UPI002ED674EA